MVVLFLALLISAANRFGGDVVGGIQHYMVSYHLIGFSYYDYQYHDPKSILHTLSYGRSSLGFLDQMLEIISRFFDFDYKSASVENADYNNQDVEIGRHEIRETNAFGTLLFTFYRDFNIAGIAVGGFLYGAVVTYARYRGVQSWRARGYFLFLASAWMVGMMVSPLEQTYFWFTVLALAFIGLANRGIKL